MAKRLPEKYNPGDLDRTRSNLGQLSKEEADRMKDILGGEIGIERTDNALQEKYAQIKKTSSKSSTSGRPGGSRTSGPNTGGSVYTAEKSRSGPAGKAQQITAPVYTGHYISKKTKKTRLSYLDRIRIDRMAAKPEHQIKTRSAVVSSYLSFLVKSKDTVNPDFIREGEQFFYNHIESLVTDLTSLLKLVKPIIFKNYINQYYRDLIKILISWDLKELNSILSDLQKSPRNREIQDCGRLCSIIYKPIVSVAHIDIKHLYAAVDRLYRVLIIVRSEEPEELVSIKNRYSNIREKIKIVFKDVSYTCYPLLLKLTGSKFQYYREFLSKDRETIIKFLSISEDSLVEPPDNLEDLGKKQYSLDHLKQKLQKEREEQQAAQKKDSHMHNESDVTKSLEILEQLFPESNWKKQKEFPDFYPYFQPLFKFPRGTELIANEDPLQQIVVLAAVIQELLYGFRSIKIKGEHAEAIDKAADGWHLFIDELIQNHYSKMLVEYCRMVEKGPEYSAGKFGQKLLTDIYWFKRRFILPHLKFKVLYKSESIPLKAPKFHEQIGKFHAALAGLMDGLENSSDRNSLIENYSDPFHFEIKNITSFRLKKVLQNENVAPTNENLLRHTLMMLSALDFLVNSQNSPFYSVRPEEIPIYRYDPVYQGKPRYSVPLIDTEALLKKY